MIVSKMLARTCLLALFMFAYASHQCGAQADIFWDKMSHDFGQVKKNSSHLTIFVMTNTSEKAVRIDNIRTNCGCTVADWQREDILPSDTAHIVVKYHTPRRAKSFRQSIKVFINTNKKPSLLSLQGRTLK